MQAADERVLIDIDWSDGRVSYQVAETSDGGISIPKELFKALEKHNRKDEMFQEILSNLTELQDREYENNKLRHKVKTLEERRV